MAESTLHESFTTIRAGIGDYLGLDPTVGNWSAADVASVEEYQRVGYKQALYPPMGEEKTPYEWSFLTPTNTLTLSSGTSTYDLPANFDGGVDTVIITTGGTTPRRLEQDSPDMLDATRIREAAATATPLRYAIRPKTPTTTSGATADLTTGAGQRWEIVLYPTPNATLTATIRYPLSVNALTATNLYALGGPLFSDLVLASCLMVAGMRKGMPDAGMHVQFFKERLVSAIVHDRRLKKVAEDLFPVTANTIGSYDWLAQEVGRALQISANQGSWSYSDAERVRSVITQGLMQFYATPPDGHRWSFLETNTTLTTVAPQSSSTVTIVAGVVTIAAGTWPTWAADGELAVDGYSYTVATRDSSTQLTLDDTSVAEAAGSTYTIFKLAYALPATFSGIDTDPITFQAGSGRESIRNVNPTRIDDLRVSGETYSYPQVYAVQPIAATTTGTAWEILFWPVADSVLQLKYRPRVVPVMLSSGQTPLGGLDHALTILSSCLAIVNPKQEQQTYMMRLQQSVLTDRIGHTAGNLGYNGDLSDRRTSREDRDEYEFWNSGLTSLNL